jgi:hypothetical protein
MFKHFNALSAGLKSGACGIGSIVVLMSAKMGRNKVPRLQRSGRFVKPGFPAPHRILVPAKPIISQ